MTESGASLRWGGSECNTNYCRRRREEEDCLESQRLFDLAYEHLMAQRYEAAVDLFGQVLARYPGHVQSHGNVALAYASLGRKALALEHLDKALALDPAYEPASQNRKILQGMTEGKAFRPVAMGETEYYRERAEAEKSPGRPSWWQKIKRLPLR